MPLWRWKLRARVELLFQKAGIAGPPKTYSEFFEDVKKLTQFNPDGSIKVAGFLPLQSGDYELANFENGVYSNAQWYSADGKSQLGTDPRFAQVLQFVKSMADNRRERLMVQSTIGLAHSLGRRVVAEGVEHRDILDLLIEMGCDIAQGFAVGRPMSIDSLTKRLSTDRKRTAA